MALQELPLVIQTSYAELIDQLRLATTSDFPEGSTFRKRSISGKDYWYVQELDTQAYFVGDGSTVLLEDALNLADALDQVFLTYEPERVDWSSEYFNGFFNPAPKSHPSIGTIKTLADFCRHGAFKILRL